MPYGPEYEFLQENGGITPISIPYEIEKEIPADPKGNDTLKGTGTRSLFNRYSVFFLHDTKTNSEEGIPSSSHMNYFDTPGLWKGETFDLNNGFDNLSTANILRICSDGNHNGVDYEWVDFLYCKHRGKIPNNRMITLRRFGCPVGDNLYSKISCPTPDIARAVGYIDEELNKLEDLLSFSVGYKWQSKESQLQTLQSTGWGRENNLTTGKWNTWSGRFISAFNNEGDALRQNDSQIESFNPYDNKENLTFGPLDVVMNMLVKEKGLNFEQDIKVNFEYEIQSFDGVNPKVAFLDLISNLLLLTYSRGEFWGGDTRFFGGARRKSLVGDDALSRLAAGDFSGFMDSAFATIKGKFNNMTEGMGFSLEGLKNFGKNMLGNFGNMLIGQGLNSIGRPEMRAMQALLTGEPTGNWHLTIGNPLNPIAMIGNLCLETTGFSFGGPLSNDDFPTKLKIECTLKHGRPRDRSDVMSMFTPHVGRVYYTEPPNSTLYAMNTATVNTVKYSKKSAAEAQAQVQKQFDQRILNDLKDVQSRFPNHFKGSRSEERITWAAQWTT